MALIRLFELEEIYGEDSYDCYQKLGAAFSDWEDVSDDQLSFLIGNRSDLERLYGKKIVIVRALDVKPIIKNLKEAIAKLEAEKEEKRRKRAEASARAALRKKAKTEEKERIILEQLQKKYVRA